MDAHDWQALHRRVARGDVLTPAELAAYEAGCQELDAGECLDGNLARLRELRSSILEAEAEQQRLRELETDLDARTASFGRRVRLPLVRCAHAARPGEELTPERVAEILLEEDTQGASVTENRASRATPRKPA